VVALPLQDGRVWVNKGPVVSDPELGQQPEGHRHVALVCLQVWIGEHQVIDGAKQSDLVARHLRVVLENRADDLV